MRPAKVILTHPVPSDWISELAGKVELEIGEEERNGWEPEAFSSLGLAEGIITFLTDHVDSGLLAHAPALRVICNYAAGTDNIDLDACTKAGIPVGYTPGVLTDATADLTLTLLLAVMRKLTCAASDARAGRWKTWYASRWLGTELRGKTLGVVGMGRIGSAVARRARAFGMRIVYTSRHPKTDLEGELEAVYLDLNDLLAQADVISLHTPLTEDTRGLIGPEALARVKPGAVLINTSRGAEVDLEALQQALENGKLAGAGLDVTDPEPLPENHPLYQVPNCLILPHIGSATHETRRAMARMTCENLLAGLRGDRLPYCANPAVYGLG